MDKHPRYQRIKAIQNRRKQHVWSLPSQAKRWGKRDKTDWKDHGPVGGVRPSRLKASLRSSGHSTRRRTRFFTSSRPPMSSHVTRPTSVQTRDVGVSVRQSQARTTHQPPGTNIPRTEGKGGEHRRRVPSHCRGTVGVGYGAAINRRHRQIATQRRQVGAHVSKGLQGRATTK